MKNHARLLFALKIAISLGLLAWLLGKIASREGMETLAQRALALDPSALLLAVFLQFVAVLAGVTRWKLLLSARQLELPASWLTKTFLVGRFIGAFTPSTTGLDGWRGLEVARRTGDALGSASVIVVEKLVGLVAMAGVTAVLAPLGMIASAGDPSRVLPIALAVGAGAGSLLWLMASPERMAGTARFVPSVARGRAEKWARALSASRLSGGRIATTVGLAVATHLSLSAVFVATGWAVGVAVAPLSLLAVGNALVLAVLVPISIGGVGVRESVAVMLLASVGVDTSHALLIALLGYLSGQVPALIGGLLLMTRKHDVSLDEHLAAS